MNRMRLTVVTRLASQLATGMAFLALASTGARAQDAPAFDAPAFDAPAPGPEAPPAATDTSGTPNPSTQPPPFTPAPIAPRTGPKASDLADDAGADTSSEPGADGHANEPPAPPEVRAEVQPEVVPPVTAQVEPVVAPLPPAPPPRGFSALGTAVLLGGGFQQFTNGNLQDVTGGGGFWNARLVAGTRQFVAVEAAYVGGAHNMNALGFGTRAALISNGVEGAMRINLPVIQGRSLFEPFGFVGMGWSRYSVVNTDTQSSDVASLDDIMTLPYGGGLALAYGAFIADARFTYRSTYFNNLMRTSGGRLDSWGVGAQLGVGF